MTDGMDQLARALYEKHLDALGWGMPSAHTGWDTIPANAQAAWRAVAEHAERCLVGVYDDPGPLVRLRMPDDIGHDIYLRPLAVTGDGLWASVPYEDALVSGLAGVTHTLSGWALVKGVSPGAAWAMLEGIDALGDIPAFHIDEPLAMQAAIAREPDLLATIGALIYKAEHWDDEGENPDD